MKIFLVVLLSLILSACAVPYVQLSNDMAVKQVNWRAGMLRHIDTSVKNTGETVLYVVMNCKSNMDGMVKSRTARLAPNQEVTFTDKVRQPLNGSIMLECIFGRR